MRKPSELFQLVLDDLELRSGICTTISYLYVKFKINREELGELKGRMKYLKPGIFDKDYWTISSLLAPTNYWWTRDKKGLKARKDFLTKIIKKLNENNA